MLLCRTIMSKFQNWTCCQSLQKHDHPWGYRESKTTNNEQVYRVQESLSKSNSLQPLNHKLDKRRRDDEARSENLKYLQMLRITITGVNPSSNLFQWVLHERWVEVKNDDLSVSLCSVISMNNLILLMVSVYVKTSIIESICESD